jgi:hypothetical protein
LQVEEFQPHDLQPPQPCRIDRFKDGRKPVCDKLERLLKEAETPGWAPAGHPGKAEARVRDGMVIRPGPSNSFVSLPARSH